MRTVYDFQQKILMLPAMPGVKPAVFTRRLVAFYETFAPLDKRTKFNPAIGVIWHEAIAGRNAEDVASAFAKCFESNRYAKSFVIWCDNCTGQNKNWTLYRLVLHECRQFPCVSGEVHEAKT